MDQGELPITNVARYWLTRVFLLEFLRGLWGDGNLLLASRYHFLPSSWVVTSVPVVDFDLGLIHKVPIEQWHRGRKFLRFRHNPASQITVFRLLEPTSQPGEQLHSITS